MNQKKLQDIKAKAKTEGKSEAEIQEKKIMKVFKDLNVVRA